MSNGIPVVGEVVELEVKKKLTAKGSSLAGQIIAAIWIAGWSAFKFAMDPKGISVTDVLMSGLGIAGCFMPVYFSILMDKIRDIRLGGKES